MIMIDASVILANVMPDEESDYSYLVMQELRDDKDEGIVPATLYLECMNSLIRSHTNRRINRDQRDEYLDIIMQLPLEVDYETVHRDRIREILDIAHKYGLESYDAAYLDLAIRRNCPLATNDSALKNAAIKRNLFYQRQS